MKNSTSTQHQTLTVRDLKEHLTKHQISPEKLAEQTQLSHMTIRRWLKRKESEVIPEKYYSLLSPLFSCKMEYAAPFPASFTVENLMTEIERSGHEFQGVEKLNQDIAQKLKTARVDRIFFDYCKQLLAAIKSPKSTLRSKAIAVGALIYFISPIDLIPDHIPVVGYLDDLAVLSLAVNCLKSEEQVVETKKRRNNEPVI